MRISIFAFTKVVLERRYLEMIAPQVTLHNLTILHFTHKFSVLNVVIASPVYLSQGFFFLSLPKSSIALSTPDSGFNHMMNERWPSLIPQVSRDYYKQTPLEKQIPSKDLGDNTECKTEYK